MRAPALHAKVCSKHVHSHLLQEARLPAFHFVARNPQPATRNPPQGSSAVTKAMAPVSNNQPFRFLDLPSELRNEVYALVLCAFEPTPDRQPQQFSRAVHSINPAILRTNYQIHREAYDIMVRRNRFVLVRSEGGFPFRTILMHSCLPIVNSDKSVCMLSPGT